MPSKSSHPDLAVESELIPDELWRKRFLPIGRTTAWRYDRQGLLPKPIRVGGKVYRRASDTRAWLEAL